MVDRQHSLGFLRIRRTSWHFDEDVSPAALRKTWSSITQLKFEKKKKTGNKYIELNRIKRVKTTTKKT